MKLLTKEIRNKLPKLRSTDGQGDDAIVIVSFFDPTGSWTWYATEGEPILDEDGSEVDFQFFGLVKGFEDELGYFNLNELASVKGRFGLGIERDMYFTRKKLGDFR
jgi:hypothetical protein